MIKPTVGRVLWYWPTAEDIKSGMFAYEGSDQPFAASVTFVHGDRMVNLSVTDHGGIVWGKRSVTLLQEGDKVRDRSGYAEWMPYQKGQAVKTEQLEQRLAYDSSKCLACGGPRGHGGLQCPGMKAMAGDGVSGD